MRLSPLERRRLIDLAINMGVISALIEAGAGYWALISVPAFLWNHYDGATRHRLER